MTPARRIGASAILIMVALLQPLSAAWADIQLSELIVELQPGKNVSEDIEVTNSGPDRAYVALQPREILRAGQPSEGARRDPDPEKLGLLVSPARMVLEPGQRKLARIATLASDGTEERVYRVTIKPVVGPLPTTTSGLKMLIGYDVLVLVRPRNIRASVQGSRFGKALTLRNDGNSSVALTEGRQCDSSGRNCVSLPAKRIYGGAQWSQTLPQIGPVQYMSKSATEEKLIRF